MLRYVLIVGVLMSVAVMTTAQDLPPEPLEPPAVKSVDVDSVSDLSVHEVYEPVLIGARVIRVGKTLSVSADQSIHSAIVVAGDVILNGSIHHSLTVIQGSVRMGPQGSVGGDLVLLMAEADFQPNQVKGEVRQIQGGTMMSGTLSLLTGPPRREADPGSQLVYVLTGYRTSWGNIWLFWKVSIFLLVLVVHVCLMAIAPNNVASMAEGIINRPLGSALIGLGIVLILIPVAGLCFFSLLGIPVILAIAMVLVILAIYGKTAIVLAIGNTIVQQERSNVLAIVLGYLIYFLATSLPFVGLPVFLVINFLSMGLSLRTRFGLLSVSSRKTGRQTDYEVKTGWDSPVRGS